MKTKTTLRAISLAALTTIPALAGCVPSGGSSDTVVEGVLLTVEYELGDGRTGGFTRLGSPASIPGGNGSWNIDAYGKLTPQFLVITRPQRKDLGPQVIPAHRLVNVQFGDGGIPEIDESAVTLPR